MTKAFVSQRREIKYLARESEMAALMDRIGKVLVADRHGAGGGYVNHSIYFDGPGLSFYREKAEGLAVRAKPRLRLYKSTADGAARAIFLEFRHRDRHFVAKQRAPLTAAEAARLLDGDTVLATAAGDGGGPLARFAYMVRRLDLRPAVGVLYHRSAYRSAIHPTLRLTFDRRLRGTACCELMPPQGAFADLLAPGRGIIEIKYNGAAPAWLLRATEALELDMVSFSKFAEAIERTVRPVGNMYYPVGRRG